MRRYLLAGLALTLLVPLLNRPDWRLRQQLLEIRHNYRTTAARYELNLKNQFTPGFKSHSEWPGKNGLKWTQGEIFKTQTPSNLAVNGQGCFALKNGDQIAYTRDGRFTFQDGLLQNSQGWALLGMPLDRLGNIIGETGPIRLDLDPPTCLYMGRFTDYRFDEMGKLHGQLTMTDPVTGQSSCTSTPLFQIMLYQFPNPGGLVEDGSLLRPGPNSGEAVSGLPGQGALGGICPSSLELSNVNFLQQGLTLRWTYEHYRAFAASAPSSPIQEELLQELRYNSQLRRAAVENLSNTLTPGYRSWDILGYLQNRQLKRRSGQGQLVQTDDPWNLALDGPGGLVLQDGQLTRNGNLVWTEHGLTNSEGGVIMGYRAGKLEPVRIPAEAANLEVTSQGVVRWIDLRGDGRTQAQYQLALSGGNPSLAQGYLEYPLGDAYEEGIEARALAGLAGLPPFQPGDPLPETPLSLMR
ncbi:hypothetical protein JST97_15760 [bacterium]|nr:hypothetical protein [bacterium]